jgi:hypothetical protein
VVLMLELIWSSSPSTLPTFMPMIQAPCYL